MQIQQLLKEGTPKRELATALHQRLIELHKALQVDAERTLDSWREGIYRQEFRSSAENLALYLALRNIDLTAEQQALSVLGLSSLGRSESHVLATLSAVTSLLEAALDGGLANTAIDDCFSISRQRIEQRRDEIFGLDPRGNSTRIQVTLPSEAAENHRLVEDLIRAGAASVRINCAHDGPDAWSLMIDHTKAAAKLAGRRVSIMMDLAGPKVRTLSLHVPPNMLTREKKKKLKKRRKAGADPSSASALLKLGDHIVLCESLDPTSEFVNVTLSHPQLLDQLQTGSMVWFDDGKIGAIVESITDRSAILEISKVPLKGARLKPEKGINLPGVPLSIPALCQKDLADLDFAIGRVDIIGFSFVQTTQDVRDLQSAISERLPQGGQMPALVLKIETDLALHNLPRLIVQAGGSMPVAVMIARGDLAVEIGLERLSEIQEEILWLCEAAEIPVIWATQVLEGLAKHGFASRAEMTDAAMGQRAECVMLNKGPHAVEAVSFLAHILLRMDRHQLKKTPRLAPLRAWRDPFGL